MPPLAAVAEAVLAPAIGSIVGPLVSQIAGPLGNALGGGIGDLIQGFEKAFLGGFQGNQSTPGAGGFPKFPQPFPQPPFVNDPFGPFTGRGGSQGSSGITPPHAGSTRSETGAIRSSSQRRTAIHHLGANRAAGYSV